MKTPIEKAAEELAGEYSIHADHLDQMAAIIRRVLGEEVPERTHGHNPAFNNGFNKARRRLLE